MSYFYVQDAGKVLQMLRDEVQRRRSSSDTSRGDLLDQAIADTNKEDKESFVKDDFIVPLTFAFLFASIESISTTSTLALKLLSEHPSALKELTVRRYAHEIENCFRYVCVSVLRFAYMTLMIICCRQSMREL